MKARRSGIRLARMTLKATNESTGGALSLVEVLAPPDFAAPWHVHRRDDEMFYILDGSFLFKCGDKLFEGGPGAFGFLPRDIPHSFKNVGETLAKFLVLGTPAGLDQYFVDAGTPALEEGLASTAHRFSADGSHLGPIRDGDFGATAFLRGEQKGWCLFRSLWRSNYPRLQRYILSQLVQRVFLR